MDDIKHEMPPAKAADTPKVHFEEFKIYLESAERTTDRRLELNKTNASLALLIIAGIGATASWSFGKDIIPYAVFAIAMISLLAAVFCRWWWRQIVSYKELNAAKFAVLNEMAPRIVYPDVNGVQCKSQEPFAREWEILQRNQSLGKFKSGFALGASLSELTVPKSFMILFIVILLICILIAILGRYDLVLISALRLT